MLYSFSESGNLLTSAIFIFDKSERGDTATIVTYLNGEYRSSYDISISLARSISKISGIPIIDRSTK